MTERAASVHRLRILMIEDDNDQAELFEARAHNERGFVSELVRATTLAHGLAVLASEPFDLVLLDLDLPDSPIDQTMGTLEHLCAQIDAPVIVLTALDDSEIGRRASAAGAQDFLSKGDLTIRRLIDASRYAIERYRLQRELAARTRDLEQYAHLVSHDLQEPLRTLSNASALIAKRYGDRLDGVGTQTLSLMTEAVERMGHLVHDLLEHSRLGVHSAVEKIDCGALVHEVVRDLSAAIAEAGATIEIGSLPTVEARRTELRLLFQNLVGNAIKFRRADAAPRIAISSESRRRCWLFAVVDNGIGIEPQHTDRIFEPFQRLHSREAFEGTGIGLAHCRKIVEMHGGRIWVEPAPGRGSTFYFTLGASR